MLVRILNVYGPDVMDIWRTVIICRVINNSFTYLLFQLINFEKLICRNSHSQFVMTIFVSYCSDDFNIGTIKLKLKKISHFRNISNIKYQNRRKRQNRYPVTQIHRRPNTCLGRGISIKKKVAGLRCLYAPNLSPLSETMQSCKCLPCSLVWVAFTSASQLCPIDKWV